MSFDTLFSNQTHDIAELRLATLIKIDDKRYAAMLPLAAWLPLCHSILRRRRRRRLRRR